VSLVDRVVLVTGAGGGLGAALAIGVAAAGAAVLVTDHDEEHLGPVAEQCRALGAPVLEMPVDLSTQGAADRLISHAKARFGTVDGLVHAAGVMQTVPLLDIQDGDWRRVIDINLTASFALLQAFGRAAAGHEASAVLIASVAARSGRPNAAHYAASKAGLLSLTKSAALAFGPMVRVNALCPGVFLTPMWQRIIADRDAEFGAGAGQAYLDEVLSAAPLGRAGQPEELSSAAVFLLSRAASYITGQALNVDGGLEMD
jgi:NAD(P)-dependent dehydrogenase (short-subunit alcohol dehydrogenase family)